MEHVHDSQDGCTSRAACTNLLYGLTQLRVGVLHVVQHAARQPVGRGLGRRVQGRRVLHVVAGQVGHVVRDGVVADLRGPEDCIDVPGQVAVGLRVALQRRGVASHLGEFLAGLVQRGRMPEW
jgi:hypothetical protein